MLNFFYNNTGKLNYKVSLLLSLTKIRGSKATVLDLIQKTQKPITLYNLCCQTHRTP